MGAAIQNPLFDLFAGGRHATDPPHLGRPGGLEGSAEVPGTPRSGIGQDRGTPHLAAGLPRPVRPPPRLQPHPAAVAAGDRPGTAVVFSGWARRYGSHSSLVSPLGGTQMPICAVDVSTICTRPPSSWQYTDAGLAMPAEGPSWLAHPASSAMQAAGSILVGMLSDRKSTRLNSSH